MYNSALYKVQRKQICPLAFGQALAVMYEPKNPAY